MASNIRTANNQIAKVAKLDDEVGCISFSRSREFKSNIFFGRGILLKEEWAKLLLGRKESQHYIITDKIVGSLYANGLSIFLHKCGLNVDVLIIPDGESEKTLKNYGRITKYILKTGIDRESYIIGLGGGVVNNMAGFIASTLYRGIGLIQIPTTLLAQVDAAIDFKQAVDCMEGKNLIGSYYPADLVVVDIELLKSLAIRQMKSGMAEIIKHALTQDKSFITNLLNYKGDLYNDKFLRDVIKRTIALKIPLLNGSSDEEYSEMLPQYGHAIGHAVEQASMYKILHGEAISIGMCVTAEIALLLNKCSDRVVFKHYEVLSKFGLPTKIPKNISDDKIIFFMKHDKHYLQGCIRSVLIKDAGSICYDNDNCVFPVAPDIVRLAFQINRSRIISHILYGKK